MLEQLITIAFDFQSQFFSPCLHLVTEKKIHKYFPTRRAMTAHSIGHGEEEEKLLQHKCFHNK